MAEDLRYPIGEYESPDNIPASQRQGWISDIEELPAQLRGAVSDLDDRQLDTRYRPEGWTLRQVVHHLPDSHMNSYIRFKLALTEENPTIRPYFEDRWGELPDSTTAHPEVSLALLEALHRRWVILLRSLDANDFARTLNHPEIGTIRLDVNLGLYSWHGRHHLAHITALRERMGW